MRCWTLYAQLCEPSVPWACPKTTLPTYSRMPRFGRGDTAPSDEVSLRRGSSLSRITRRGAPIADGR